MNRGDTPARRNLLMHRLTRSWTVWAVGISLIFAAAARPAAAQTLTTGTLSGVITDQQGGVLPGVAVVAVHEPTGTRYEAISVSDGRFYIPNVRPGGPYTITATL